MTLNNISKYIGKEEALMAEEEMFKQNGKKKAGILI